MIPVNELSIFVSAMQNKNAGKKLPRRPEARISIHLSFGNFLICLNAEGSNTNPALNKRIAATWYALKLRRPAFINMKELPQINDKARKISQFINRSRGGISEQR
jgi:hypothetical protein